MFAVMVDEEVHIGEFIVFLYQFENACQRKNTYKIDNM